MGERRCVCGDGEVSGGGMWGNSKVSDDGQVSGDSKVSDDGKVKGDGGVVRTELAVRTGVVVKVRGRGDVCMCG